jgi:hypothetical protein
LVLAQAAYAATAPADLPKADKTWEEVSKDDSVLVHRKEIPGSDVVAFRGETVIDAPIAKVANVLIDTSRKKEWVFRIVEARDVRQMGLYERVEYNHTASGFFLVKDRDFVFHAKAELNKEKGQMVIRLKSIEEPSVPEQGPVRGYIDNSAYTLTSLDNGTKTHLVVEIHADPKGSVPKWLVNLFQKSWPAKTLNGIRAQCAKPDVVEHAGLKEYFSTPAVATAPAEKAPVSAVRKN